MAALPQGDPIDPNPPLGDYPGYLGYPGWPAPSGSSGPSGPSADVDAEPRPGAAVASAVLGLLTASLLLVSGFVVIFAADSLDADADGFASAQRTALFVLSGLGDVIAAGLLVIGAVLVLARSRGARPATVIGALLCLLLGAFWLTEESANGSIVIWLMVFCGPAVTAALLTLTARVTAWLNLAPRT